MSPSDLSGSELYQLLAENPNQDSFDEGDLRAARDSS